MQSFDEFISEVTVYHGTKSHEWEKNRPDLKFLGTGEGAVAFGYGFYVTETPAIAKQYMGFDINVKRNIKDRIATINRMLDAAVMQRKTEDQIQKMKDNRRKAEEELANATEPSLFKMKLPDDIIPKMILWDEPYSKQSNYVKEKLNRDYSNITGEKIYKDIANEKGGFDKASKYLASIGIPGVKYLDGFSRSKGLGTFNYVIWDQKILNKMKVVGKIKISEIK